MVFSSLVFLAWFLPAFLVLYFLAPARRKNAVALCGSLFFYAWGGPLFVFVLLGSITLDYFIALAIAAGGARRRWITLSVLVNLSFLAYSKYANFFIDNVNAALGTELPLLDVVMPIGISFFTFQKLSYVIDVSRGRAAAMRSWPDYALYVLLFPQLIAGPIVRFHEIADQLVDRRARDTIDDKLMGLYRFILGLSKKVLLANYFASLSEPIFAMPASDLSSWIAWVGVLAFSFQIYFDFSGYSDMAIGLGRMLGFRLPDNFDFPYIARSITEFWRRWHITLGNWMRDYLYVPLGGNRFGPTRMYANLCAVFLLSGLWHGAEWSFILWGVWHGGFLVLDRVFLADLLERAGAIPATALTFLVVVVGWVFFNARDVGHAGEYLLAMFGGSQRPLADFDPRLWPDAKMVLMFSLAATFSFMGAWPGKAELFRSDTLIRTRLTPLLTASAGCGVLLVLCVMSISATGFSPFLYFRF